MSGFAVAGDMVWVHGQRAGTAGHRPQGGTHTPFRSLPPACFLISFAAGEALVTEASKALGVRADNNGVAGAPLGLGSSGLVDRYAKAGIALTARARVRPRPGSKTGIHPWVLLESADLDGYLRDANTIRNRLAHRGSSEGDLRTDWFAKVPERGLPNVTLMLAEGMLQAAQDIAYLAQSAACPRTSVTGWSWVLPERAQTGRIPARLRDLAQFPLPSP